MRVTGDPCLVPQVVVKVRLHSIVFLHSSTAILRTSRARVLAKGDNGDIGSQHDSMSQCQQEDDDATACNGDDDDDEGLDGLGRWYLHLLAQRYVFVSLGWLELTTWVRSDIDQENNDSNNNNDDSDDDGDDDMDDDNGRSWELAGGVVLPLPATWYVSSVSHIVSTHKMGCRA